MDDFWQRTSAAFKEMLEEDLKMAAVNFESLWYGLLEWAQAKAAEATRYCVTDPKWENVLRNQGIAATFGDVLNTMQTMELEARGGEPDDLSDQEHGGDVISG